MKIIFVLTMFISSVFALDITSKDICEYQMKNVKEGQFINSTTKHVSHTCTKDTWEINYVVSTSELVGLLGASEYDISYNFIELVTMYQEEEILKTICNNPDIDEYFTSNLRAVMRYNYLFTKTARLEETNTTVTIDMLKFRNCKR